MKSELELKIFRIFRDFVESEEGKAISKQDNKLGNRVRVYYRRYKKDKLRYTSALSLLIDLGVVKDFIIKDFK